MGYLKGRDFTSLKFYNLPHSGKGQAPVFDVFEAFLNTDNIQVFANAATSYIMCLMKFVKGLGKWSPPFMPCDSWRPFPAWLCRESPGDRPSDCLEQASSLGQEQMVCVTSSTAGIFHCVHGIILS